MSAPPSQVKNRGLGNHPPRARVSARMVGANPLLALADSAARESLRVGVQWLLDRGWGGHQCPETSCPEVTCAKVDCWEGYYRFEFYLGLFIVGEGLVFLLVGFLIGRCTAPRRASVQRSSPAAVRDDRVLFNAASAKWR